MLSDKIDDFKIINHVESDLKNEEEIPVKEKSKLLGNYEIVTYDKDENVRGIILSNPGDDLSIRTIIGWMFPIYFHPEYSQKTVLYSKSDSTHLFDENVKYSTLKEYTRFKGAYLFETGGYDSSFYRNVFKFYQVFISTDVFTLICKKDNADQLYNFDSYRRAYGYRDFEKECEEYIRMFYDHM